MTVPESKEWFFDYVNTTYATVVMQDWTVIRDQLNICGIPWKDVWCSIYPEMNEKNATECGKRMLIDLYKRRNEIAHQNDRSHASAEQNDISKEYVQEKIQEIESFVSTIHTFALQKD